MQKAVGHMLSHMPTEEPWLAPMDSKPTPTGMLKCTDTALASLRLLTNKDNMIKSVSFDVCAALPVVVKQGVSCTNQQTAPWTQHTW
jgi:hypothetical protein